MSELILPVTKNIALKSFTGRLRDYWTLIKALQTGLLLVTAAAGYVSGCCLNLEAGGVFPMLGSLFLAISGSTILNMVIDRDIDARMRRTARRPLPRRKVSVMETLVLGAALTIGGLVWAFIQSFPFACVVLAGVFLDVVVYTLWLKHRTAFSILIGGLAGGAPALAGRTLAVGSVDSLGILLGLAILCWIPIHIMTYHIKHQPDFNHAGIPTFPACLGVPTTHILMALFTLAAVGLVLWVGALVGVPSVYFDFMKVLGLGMTGLVVWNGLRPHKKLNFILFKSASVYMLISMIILILGGL